MRIWLKTGVIALALLASPAFPVELESQGVKTKPQPRPATYNEILELENELMPAIYPHIRDVSLEILERFPPDRYYYVGIGRSPTPVMAFLEGYGIKGQATIPISRLKDYAPRSTAATDERLRNHFREFLPPEAELNGRKILIVDYVHSGNSMAKTVSLVKGILPLEKVEIFALGHTPFTPPGLPVPFHRSHQPNEAMSAVYRNQKFDPWAKHHQFHALEVGYSAKPVLAAQNSDHRHLKAAMENEMAKDAYLKAVRYKANCPANFASLR